MEKPQEPHKSGELVSSEITPVGVAKLVRTTEVRDRLRAVEVGNDKGQVWLGLVNKKLDDADFQTGSWEYLTPDQADHIATLLIASAAKARTALTAEAPDV